VATEEESEYGLVMPFILVKSNGGPFDDAAFVAGMTCGALYQELENCAPMQAVPRARYIQAQLVPQIDLIAMKHGYQLRLGDYDEASGWQHVSFDTEDGTPPAKEQP
jgi:hypothetical protein